MKKIINVIIGIFLTGFLFSQSPDAFKYQAVVRDNTGNLITEQNVGFQIDILKGATDGPSVFTETHSASTNAFGLVDLSIGTGTSTDDFSAINWGEDEYFIQIKLDATGGASYELMGTSQLLSVPYALHSKTADSIQGDVNEIDPVFDASVASSITSEDTTRWNASSPSMNIINSLSFPDGFEDFEPVTVKLDSAETYTIPEGKNFYPIQCISGVLNIETDSIGSYCEFGIPLEGAITSTSNNPYGSNILNGFLVKAKVKPVWSIITLTLEYTVPECYAFVLKGVALNANGSGKIMLNSEFLDGTGFSTDQFYILNSGDVINLEVEKWEGEPGPLVVEKAYVIGYLILE